MSTGEIVLGIIQPMDGVSEQGQIMKGRSLKIQQRLRIGSQWNRMITKRGGSHEAKERKHPQEEKQFN